jgi:flagellar biosynthesis protein FlhG
MAIDKINGLAIVSGKGGVGKSLIALNLALATGKMGIKTMLFDAAGGNLATLANTDRQNSGSRLEQSNDLAENVTLHTSSLRNPCLVTNSKGIRSLLQEIIRIVPGYKCIIFDCPTGVNAISQTLAGLSEKVALISSSDPTSIAGAYIVARAFEHEGLAPRIGLLFNQVENIEEAASLKTRFDIMSKSFLKCQFNNFGHVRKDKAFANSALEQSPALSNGIDMPAASDISTIANDLFSRELFQNVTTRLKAGSVIGN